MKTALLYAYMAFVLIGTPLFWGWEFTLPRGWFEPLPWWCSFVTTVVITLFIWVGAVSQYWLGGR